MQCSGTGLGLCAAIATLITLAAGESAECVFLIGFGANPTDARQRSCLRRSARTRCARWNKLLWVAPDMLRQRIVLNASRQFPEGDVQHWWHAPTGAGVRTHFSDDLLWLPHACVHHLQCTGDTALLDEIVPFIEGAAIPDGAEDAYHVPSPGEARASVYEHVARAIDRSLWTGTHGLPLVGSGDWNDGMNRVGIEGRGESVWLGWFLCALVEDFAPIARQRGETGRAQRWEVAASGWRAALQGDAWDGQWYQRAFFDDGTPLGTPTDTECRIDLIAQAWSVIAGAAPPAFQRMALEAVERHLVDAKHGLVKLLTPPLQHKQPSAGYIQAYPPGVRENGGQYSHAGVWAVIAQAQSGNADTAYRYFTFLSPAHRAASAEWGAAYAIEPYVMAGDVYTQAPCVGRGGWSWYTGSAAWMQRAAIEHLFGLRQRGEQISFLPCLPSHWNEAELTLRRSSHRRSAPCIEHRPQRGAVLQRQAQQSDGPRAADSLQFIHCRTGARMSQKKETASITQLPVGKNERLVLNDEALEAAKRSLDQGAVTPSYGPWREDIIKLLNDSLATELVCVMRYKRHHYTAKGLASPKIAEEFMVHALEETAHADSIAERIVQLGGEPDFSPATLLERSHAEYDDSSDLKAMIKANLIAERVAIEAYSQMIALIGDKDSTTRRLLEQILSQEQEHADELSDWMTA